jgi:Protein of unknown function (DUF3618)
MDHRDTSLSTLEGEAERNRAELAQTVGALHDRITPDAIKKHAATYVQGKRQEFFQSIERKARENPLQALAIGAGLALPLWRIVSSIPLPILLVGAGLALTSSNAPADAGNTVGDLKDQVRTKIGEHADAVAEQLHDGVDALKKSAAQAAGGVADTAQRVGSAISSQAGKLAAQATQAVSESADAARAMGSDAATAISEAAISAYSSGTEAVSNAGNQVAEITRRSQDKLIDVIERHPLLVGGIGLALGALIASSLPSTQIEGRAVGGGSDALKAKAAELAATGLEAAKTVAGEVYADASREAERQGLTSQSLREAAANIGDTVASVVARATNGDGSPSPSGDSAPALART